MNFKILKRDWAKYNEDECVQVLERIQAWEKIKRAYEISIGYGKAEYDRQTDKSNCKLCFLYQDQNFNDLGCGEMEITFACRRCPIVRATNHTCGWHYEKSGWDDRTFESESALDLCDNVIDFLGGLYAGMNKNMEQ